MKPAVTNTGAGAGPPQPAGPTVPGKEPPGGDRKADGGDGRGSTRAGPAAAPKDRRGRSGSRAGRIWLPALVALVALAVTPRFGVRLAIADHFNNSTKVCTTSVSAINCTLTLGRFDRDIPAGQLIRVTVTGNAQFSTATPPTISSAGPAPCTATIATGPDAPTATVFRVRIGPGGCPAGSAIVIGETLVPIGAGGGPLTQRIESGFAEPLDVAAVTPAGEPFTVPGIFEGSTSVCVVTGSGADMALSCTLTIGPFINVPAGTTIAVTMNGAGGPGTAVNAILVPGDVARAGGGCPTTAPEGVTQVSFYITTTDACSGSDVVVITQRLRASAGQGPLCQTIEGAGTAVVVCATTPRGTPFGVPQPQQGPPPQPQEPQQPQQAPQQTDPRRCADFPSQAEAQAAYRANPSGLLHLDTDQNGIACEQLSPPRDAVPVPVQQQQQQQQQQQPTKICTPEDAAAGATVRCAITLRAAQPSPFVITVAGAAVTSAGCEAPDTACTAVEAGATITVTCGPQGAPVACPAGTFIAEALTDTAPVGFTETLNEVALERRTLAELITDEDITKRCSAGRAPLDIPVTCAVTTDVAVPSPFAARVTDPAGATIVNAGANGTTISVTCPAPDDGGPPTCAPDTRISETITSPVAGELTEQVCVGPAPATCAAIDEEPQVTFVEEGVFVEKDCAPQPNGVPEPTENNIFVRVGQAVTCVVTISEIDQDDDEDDDVPLRGSVTVTLDPTAATFAAGAATTTRTFTCVPVRPPPAEDVAACTFTEVFFPVTACIRLTQTVTFRGQTFTNIPVVGTVDDVPNVPLFVLPKAGTGQICPGTVQGFNQPFGFLFTCESTAGETTISPQPGRRRGRFFVGIGILPETINCTAELLDLEGNVIRAAPGTMEVSVLNGSLINASGRLTTNLRIDCDVPPEEEEEAREGEDVRPITFSPGVFFNIDPNTCIGVQFAIVGKQAGPVEFRVRYEPDTAPAAAGIQEIEGTGRVAFVAPSVGLTLELDPNPVAVGETGEATVSLTGTAPACGDANGGRCVDPVTGLPIRIRGGSVLNGYVKFMTEDPAIAFFTEAPLGTNEVVIRCGVAPERTRGTLAFFFGGCGGASATYRGNSPGEVIIQATFVPDLQGAFGEDVTVAGLPAPRAALIGLLPRTHPTDFDILVVCPSETQPATTPISPACDPSVVR